MTQQDLEHRYYDYLYSKGYSSPEALRKALQWYLPSFNGFQRVLDIGCGNGEFLQLLQGAGHEAVGVDIDPAMVEQCRQQGLTAVTADVRTWLPTQAGAFDAIFSSNVIEHLDAETVATIVAGAYAALRPGGLLLLGTPNPESAIVHLHEYWRDPTHVRLYSRQLLEFFLYNAGFARVQSDVNRETHWDGVDHMLHAFNSPPASVTEEAPERRYWGVADLHPWPPPPSPKSSLRQRLSYRVLHLVFKKLLEPYLDVMRTDLAHHQQQLVQLQAQVDWLQRRLLAGAQLTAQQMEQLGHSTRFLYPPREVFVYGYKPEMDDKVTG